MSVKNVYLKKKIEGTIYDIYPHTDAGIVTFTRAAVGNEGQGNTTTTVDVELAALRTLIADTEARILGLTDEHANDTIVATYDTIREIASYLSTNGDAIATINSLNNTINDSSTGLVKRVSDLETTVGNASSGLVKGVADNAADITALQTTVGDASSGLVKGVADNAADITALETTVGDASSGLVKRVTDLETATSSAGGVYVVDSIAAGSASDNALYIVLDEEEEEEP